MNSFFDHPLITINKKKPKDVLLFLSTWEYKGLRNVLEMSFSYWVRALGIVKIYGKAGQKKIDTGQGDMCHLEFKGTMRYFILFLYRVLAFYWLSKRFFRWCCGFWKNFPGTNHTGPTDILKRKCRIFRSCIPMSIYQSPIHSFLSLFKPQSQVWHIWLKTLWTR